jgi:hypothetical protein
VRPRAPQDIAADRVAETAGGLFGLFGTDVDYMERVCKFVRRLQRPFPPRLEPAVEISRSAPQKAANTSAYKVKKRRRRCFRSQRTLDKRRYANQSLLENREDHWSVAVRAERALVCSFTVKNVETERLSNGRLPRLGGSSILSFTDRCQKRAAMDSSCASVLRTDGQYCSLPEIYDVVQPNHLRQGFRQFDWIDFLQSSFAGTIHRRISYHRTMDILSDISWRWSMPHYYFDIKDGHTLVDPSGLNFKTDDDAIARAEAIAIVVSIDTPLVDPKRHIAVLNGSREEIFRVPIYSKPTMSTT